jgi:polyketide cyclase/dehydrase/lipid transport protein
MKVLKIIAIVIVAIIALILIVAAFLPSEVTVERSTVVEAPDSVVFAYISDFSVRADWDPWLELEPNAKVTLNETTKGVGAGYAWEGEEIGSGKMVINEVVENKYIKSTITFFSPQTSEGVAEWLLEPAENGTNLTWRFNSEMGYPVERFFGFMMDGMLGPSLEKGMENVDHEVVNMLILMQSDTTDLEMEEE